MHLSGGFSKAYKEQGVQKFYTQQGSNYSNPHRYDIQRLLKKKLGKKNPWISQESKILDLACGSGEITIPLMTMGYKNIQGADPYTVQPYKKNTKKQCFPYSFMNILQDCFGDEKFDCIICSYAMHLVKQSLMHDFCNKLSELSRLLIIISPHKFPILKENYGWSEIENSVQDKIHFRLFRSYNFTGEGSLQEESKKELGDMTQGKGKIEEEGISYDSSVQN